jgi:hypothetical protein
MIEGFRNWMKLEDESLDLCERFVKKLEMKFQGGKE